LKRQVSGSARHRDIYVGEVGVTDWKTSFPDEEMPVVVRATRCLQKPERVRG
jgi:hypothetical protein